jgi:hypothetical protein
MDPNETPAIVPAQPPSIVVEARIAARAVKRMKISTFYHRGRKAGGSAGTPDRL